MITSERITSEPITIPDISAADNALTDDCGTGGGVSMHISVYMFVCLSVHV